MYKYFTILYSKNMAFGGRWWNKRYKTFWHFDLTQKHSSLTLLIFKTNEPELTNFSGPHVPI